MIGSLTLFKMTLFTLYIVVGESNVTNNESSATMRETVGIVIHVYSQFATQYEAKLILSAIGYVLNRPIEIDNYEFRFSRIDSQAVFPDIDRFTKHGTIRLLFKYRHKKKKRRSVLNGAKTI